MRQFFRDSDQAFMRKKINLFSFKNALIAIKIVFILLISHSAFAQSALIYGKVKSESGENMPYTNVVVLGKAIGTSTNYDGEYSLNLKPGNYKISFQFIGFKSEVHEISIKENEMLEINPVLSEEKVLLKTVEVSAKAENPAYAIIRNAQEKRKTYLNEHENLSFKIYTKLFGQSESNSGNPVNLFGTLLTPKKGVFYLSESVNEVFQYDIENQTESLEASLVLGDTSEVTKNNTLYINLYKNRAFYIGNQMVRNSIISPIANDAFGFYDYDYLGTFEEAGESIHKIKIIPKMKGSTTFKGDLYIIDGSWRIFKSHLNLNSITGDLEINTQYIKDEQVGTYLPFSSSFILNEERNKTEIYYHNIFYDYSFEAENPKKSKLLNKVISKDGIQKDAEWWSKTRPIELTNDERLAYQKSPMLNNDIFRFEKVENDSLFHNLNEDKKDTPFQVYQKTVSSQKVKFTDNLNLDLSIVTFNTVEGGVLKPHLRYSNEFKNNHRYALDTELRYGFGSNSFYYKGGFEYELNPKNISLVKIEGGSTVEQISGATSISNYWNLFYTLLESRNFLKLYRKDFVALNWKRELFNGLDFSVRSSYNYRSPLQNNTDYTWYNDEEETRIYTPNQAFIGGEYRNFGANNLWESNLTLSYQHNRKFDLINGRKIALGSAYPTLRLGLDVGKMDSEYTRIWGNISDNWDVGVLGFSKISLSYGQYLDKNNLTPIDFFHFMGNQTFVFQNQKQFGLAYQLLDYYQYSTADYFAGANFEHDFDGAILGRIPLLKKIGLKSYFMANYLQTAESPRFAELGIGLTSSFFPIRLNYFFGYENEKFVRQGFILHTAF
ncbi:DUF5686 and carboxypeptidase regulatory-like domain-containing protein [Marivirga sp.]|uniref:DUF5686 and carboxypeptidase regulatory-like domain-containing protein n=1 Tax=Marivirga sp. TaxID=2018662 RepID=UPI002D7FB001|nr:DUF5686 and carboxypeptidase regulatory-like domain-containing protein [Marivirga sp.]HET8860091.1 DUF5686 and carboxypeptidase regulatory-like domain-containing protein [Marivirga sp.]